MCIPLIETDAFTGGIRAIPHNRTQRFTDLYETYAVKMRNYFATTEFPGVPRELTLTRLGKANCRYMWYLSSCFENHVNSSNPDDDVVYERMKREFDNVWNMMHVNARNRVFIVRKGHDAILSYIQPIFDSTRPQLATLRQFVRTHSEKWIADLYGLECERDGYEVSANDNEALQMDVTGHRRRIVNALCAEVCATSIELKKYATETLGIIFQRQ